MTFFALHATVAYVPVAFDVTVTTAMIMIVGCRNAFLRFYESILSTFA